MAEIRIRGEPTANPQVCRFVIARSLHAGNASFASAAAAEGAPLAEALFALPGVSAVTIARDTVSVTKQGDAAWPEIGKEIGNTIRAQIASGEPAVGDVTPLGGKELFERVQAILTNEINPSIANQGGVVTLQRVEDGKREDHVGAGEDGVVAQFLGALGHLPGILAAPDAGHEAHAEFLVEGKLHGAETRPGESPARPTLASPIMAAFRRRRLGSAALPQGGTSRWIVAWRERSPT